MLILYLIACIFLFSVLYYMSISVLMEFQIHSKKKRVYGGFYVLIYEARTRQEAVTCEGHRYPRVQSRPAMSCHVAFGQFQPTRADSSCIGRYGQFKLKFQKKMCETHRLNQILNPTFSSLHTNTSNKLFASLSLRHSSLTLSVLSANVSACYETLNQCQVSHLAHFSSFLFQLSLSHAFLNQVAFNLSLIFDFNDL